jgi:hypothetical protein
MLVKIVKNNGADVHVIEGTSCRVCHFSFDEGGDGTAIKIIIDEFCEYRDVPVFIEQTESVCSILLMDNRGKTVDRLWPIKNLSIEDLTKKQ